MIVWRGWGILVVFIAGAAVALVQVLGNALLGEAAARYGDRLPALGLLLAAPPIWLLGRRLNGRGARTLVDQETGEQVVVRPNHSLFFVKMEYWAVTLALGAVVLAVAGPLGG